MQDTERIREIEQRLRVLEGIAEQLCEDSAYGVHLLELFISQLPCVVMSDDTEVMQ